MCIYNAKKKKDKRSNSDLQNTLAVISHYKKNGIFRKKKKKKSKATEYTRTTVIEYDQKSIQTDSSFLILFLNLLMFWAVFL